MTVCEYKLTFPDGDASGLRALVEQPCDCGVLSRHQTIVEQVGDHIHLTILHRTQETLDPNPLCDAIATAARRHAEATRTGLTGDDQICGFLPDHLRRAYYRWRNSDTRIRLSTADAVATRLGLHLADIYPDLFMTKEPT